MSTAVWLLVYVRKKKDEKKQGTGQEDVCTLQLRQFQLEQLVCLSSQKVFVTLVVHRTYHIHRRQVK